MIELDVDGQKITVPEGITVAAALALRGDGCSRTSVTGRRRAPVCGMGVCQECRVIIDGERRLACQTLCRPAMRVNTHETD
ncbi:(2Fe-2S)-binding protein [Martelella alba]|uniref:(2Fe-2S)-binding protein n=1 Tax=Martelella alba TaxID=2590451 RepID=A0ABY2SSG4_9HYPH|nr:(2Fe-2S)-binding protein [Martelella alba]TKI07858.1 (2Fe-2S)-binding protein [Martelella alba]